jgi:hypothetical protein
MKIAGYVEYLSILYVWIPLTLPLSLDFVRCDDWAIPISFKWTKKVCLFNSVKSKKEFSSRYIEQFQRHFSEARITF